MVNARKHKTPSETDTTVSDETIFETFGNSIRDVVPVATVTERTLLVNTLTGVGEGPSPTRPLVVLRNDAPGLHRIEYTTDGVSWFPASGSLQFTSQADLNTWTTSYAGSLVPGDTAVAGTTTLVWQGTMWVPNGVSAPHWVARRTVPYNMQDGDLAWDTVLYEGTLGGFSTADWITFTCTVPGMYLLTAQAAAASTGTTFAGVFLNKNGSDIALSPWTTNTTGVTSQTVVTSTRFGVGDRFKVRVSAGGPISGQTNLNQTKLTVNFLRP